MSRTADAFALTLSGVLHGGLLAAGLALAWDGQVPSLRFVPVVLVEPERELRPPDPPPAPRLEPVRPVVRPSVPRQPPAPPRTEPPVETRPMPPLPVAPPLVTAAAPEAASPPQPVAAASATSPAEPLTSTGDTATTAAVVASPADGQARADRRPVSAPSVASIPAPTTGPITQAARPRGGYQVRPPYPMEARQARAEGTTLLRVHITADGGVDEVHVDRSAGHTALDRAATEAVSKWRFEPARNGAGPVAIWVVIPVSFTLRNDF